jgi:predicted component of type VI protein secretion system
MRLELRLELPQQRVSAHTFDQHGGFIGSDPECEWVIEGAGYRLARRHALVAFDEELFWLCDESVDGIFHNDSPTPIGRGNRVAVADGDRFQIGNFQVAASLQRSGDPREAIAGRATSSALAASPIEAPAIPDDWLSGESGLASPPPRELPTLAVTRRLAGLQHSASEALLKELIKDGPRPAIDLDAAAVAAVGKALRQCVDALLGLCDEVQRLERDLASAPADSLPTVTPTAADLCQRLLTGDERDEALRELKRIVETPQGVLRALHESAAEAVEATLELFRPTRVSERFDGDWAARKDDATSITLVDRLLRARGLWRYYCNWHGQMERQSKQRADRRLFDKRLLAAYRARRRTDETVMVSCAVGS